MATRIEVKNRLEVLPGGIINIPGCEPVSAFSSNTLSINLSGSGCKASVISVEDALNAIPEARLVRVFKPRGFPGTGLFFELPSGPPPDGNDCNCPRSMTDYYKILKENATPIDYNAVEEEGPLSNCKSDRDYSNCLKYQDQFHKAPDPNIRPNQQPLGGNSQ